MLTGSSQASNVFTGLIREPATVTSPTPLENAPQLPMDVQVLLEDTKLRDKKEQ